MQALLVLSLVLPLASLYVPKVVGNIEEDNMVHVVHHMVAMVALFVALGAHHIHEAAFEEDMMVVGKSVVALVGVLAGLGLALVGAGEPWLPYDLNLVELVVA